MKNQSQHSAPAAAVSAPLVESFRPPPRVLMGPGPSEVSEAVLAAQARATIGHLDPSFSALMEEVKSLLRYAFQTGNELTMPVSAPGSAGMETCFVNLIEPGECVIVCQNGVFGGRMKENVERIGAVCVLLEEEWGAPVCAERVTRAFAAHPDAVALAFVHAETSTGAASDAQALCEIARRHGALSIVDAVTSLGGIPLQVDGWGIDAVYSGTQKCLSAPPGISPISFNARAVAKMKNRRARVPSWFLDLNLVMGYWSGAGGRSYHHTAPVNAIYALHEALLALANEGLENSWARHRRMHHALRDGLLALGLEFLVDEAHRLPQLNAVRVPEGIDEARVRAQVLAEHNLEIGAGLGPLAGKIWRIGLMGHACREDNVELCLRAMRDALREQGHQFAPGRAVTP
ncbi:MAG: alanine--glyoxylate aminotransferase family protein [Gammaproteobacteria bacterium]